MENITQLQDTATVELFYLNAKQSVFKVRSVHIDTSPIIMMLEGTY